MTDARKYLARLISAYAGMPDAPRTHPAGAWYVAAEGYTVDLLIAGSFLTFNDGDIVAEYLKTQTNNAWFWVVALPDLGPCVE